ncbi:isoaspartyl peptidase/L-asparaginase, partial [Vibrio cholerae O1]|nr:isoaspartyl peptidase/L-asparaginase [Vibrio cholerae O1]
GEEMSDGLRMVILASLVLGVRAGHLLLVVGAVALVAVVAAVTVLEDSPLFNAGNGSVLTNN